jgi:hypothetical protein
LAIAGVCIEESKKKFEGILMAEGIGKARSSYGSDTITGKQIEREKIDSHSQWITITLSHALFIYYLKRDQRDNKITYFI